MYKNCLCQCTGPCMLLFLKTLGWGSQWKPFMFQMLCGRLGPNLKSASSQEQGVKGYVFFFLNHIRKHIGVCNNPIHVSKHGWGRGDGCVASIIFICVWRTEFCDCGWKWQWPVLELCGWPSPSLLLGLVSKRLLVIKLHSLGVGAGSPLSLAPGAFLRW